MSEHCPAVAMPMPPVMVCLLYICHWQPAVKSLQIFTTAAVSMTVSTDTSGVVVVLLTTTPHLTTITPA
jgi:hypothetical protein